MNNKSLCVSTACDCWQTRIKTTCFMFVFVSKFVSTCLFAKHSITHTLKVFHVKPIQKKKKHPTLPPSLLYPKHLRSALSFRIIK